jgi:hypothetical protein
MGKNGEQRKTHQSRTILVRFHMLLRVLLLSATEIANTTAAFSSPTAAITTTAASSCCDASCSKIETEHIGNLPYLVHQVLLIKETDTLAAAILARLR